MFMETILFHKVLWPWNTVKSYLHKHFHQKTFWSIHWRFSLPGRPDRGTAASRWAPERTTTPPRFCWLSGCPGWGDAGAPGRGGVCWRSWTHSWDGGCGPSPSGRGLEEDRKFRHLLLSCRSDIYQSVILYTECAADWPSCLHPSAGRWGTACASSWCRWRASGRSPRPGRTWETQSETVSRQETGTQGRFLWATLRNNMTDLRRQSTVRRCHHVSHKVKFPKFYMCELEKNVHVVPVNFDLPAAICTHRDHMSALCLPDFLFP